MSLRYTGAWMQDGAFNPLVSPAPQYTYNLWDWGNNYFGNLGLGNTTYYSSPKQVGSLSGWGYVYGGYGAVSSVKTDGTLWTWGRNNQGQLGLGNTTSYSSPKQVGALTNWLSISCGYAHSLAIKTDGTLWSWGFNAQGQLGLGNTTSRSSPTQVGSLSNWKSASASGPFGNFSVAIKTDGTLWSWGQNNQGQLGLGNTTYYSSPKQIGALTNWSSVFGGNSFCAAIKTDGTLWAWGYNYQGQLGLSNNTSYSSPKQVGALTSWLTAASGSYFIGAIRTNNTLWMWGINNNGNLGIGNTTYSFNSPQQVGALTDWLSISCCSYHSIANKTSGTLWSWGRGAGGALGLGNTTSYSSPKQVGSDTSWNVSNCRGASQSFVLKY